MPGLFKSETNWLQSLLIPCMSVKDIVWAHSSLAPRKTPEAKNGTDFQLGIHGTSDQEPIWVMPVMTDSVSMCVDFVNNRCKMARVENFYFSSFIHFIFSTVSIECKRCMCLFCGYVGKVTHSVWKLLNHNVRYKNEDLKICGLFI